MAERKAFVYGDATRNICGAIVNGVPEQTANDIYDEIIDFANYAFNKAHAVCYAKVSYDTAYLKCHYPKEYLAALMTSVLDSSVKISEYIVECKACDIPVLPPDLNESNDYFTVTPGGIRFGLAAIKNIGRGFIQKVMAEREESGTFRSLEDFCRRMCGTDLNKRALENLIKSGACDCFGLHRSQMLQIFETVLDSVTASRRKNVEGQLDLFGGFLEESSDPLPPVHIPELPELPRQELMQLEKETTGLYLSGHPMDEYRPLLASVHAAPIGQIMESFTEEGGAFRDEQSVTVAGIVQTVKMKTTKNNSMMAYVRLEDDTGAIELLVFSNALGQFGSYLHENAAVVVQGRISVRDDKDPQIVLNSARPLAELEADPLPPQRPAQPARPLPDFRTLYLRVPLQSAPEARKTLAILKMFPGKSRTVVFYADTRTQMGGACQPEDVMLDELRSLLGADSVVLK